MPRVCEVRTDACPSEDLLPMNAQQTERAPIGWLRCAREGARRTAPIAISSGLFGILYGAACSALGISAGLSVLSCLLVFSGAVQFAALGLLDPPLSLAALAVSSLLISNRLILMGASISDHLSSRPLVLRLLVMPILTDGNWASTVGEGRALDRFPFFVGGGLAVLLLWMAGAALGAAIAGVFAPEVLTALRFSGALFLILLLLLVVRNTGQDHRLWLISGATAAAASLLLPLALAFLVGVVVGATVACRGEGGRK